jgi:lysyl-tRNA synthetase class II
VQALSKAKALNWPRIQNSSQDMTIRDFQSKYKYVKKDGSVYEDTVVIRGRVTSCRLSSNKLAFIDIVQDYMQVQVVCNFSSVIFTGISQKDFKSSVKLIQRGDIICK